MSILKKYITDQRNDKEVKSIYFVKKSKINRDVRYMVWQYYRDRKKNNVNDVIKSFDIQKKQVFEMRIIYKGDSNIYSYKRRKHNENIEFNSTSEN